MSIGPQDFVRPDPDRLVETFYFQPCTAQRFDLEELFPALVPQHRENDGRIARPLGKYTPEQPCFGVGGTEPARAR